MNGCGLEGRDEPWGWGARMCRLSGVDVLDSLAGGECRRLVKEVVIIKGIWP